MAQLDSYLVEKLREILERLYSKDQGDSSGLTQQNLDFEGTDTPHHQHQQVTYKRSPSLFPYAPTVEQVNNMLLQSKSESEIGRSVSLSSVERDPGAAAVAGNEYAVNSNNGSVVDMVSTQDFGIPLFSANESSLSDRSNYSDPITYGVEVNYTTRGRGSEHLSTRESLKEELDDINSEDASEALTRNLHEFIHFLKMSLKAGSTEFSSQKDHMDNLLHGDKDGGILNPSETYTGKDITSSRGGGSTNHFSDIHTSMDLNLTLDDIMDLNSLLEGDDTFGIPFKHILIIVIYVVIACVSIIGNLLVIQLVVRSRRFHTLTHALLSNLAVADLLLAFLNIPFSAARVIMTEWPFGSILCRTLPFVQVTSVYATSFTMVVIAVDRYQVIMNPLGKRLKCSQGVILVIAIWIVSASLSVPYALNHQVVTVLTVRVVKRCQAEFGSLEDRQILTVATFLAQYLLPLLFTTASYIAIMKRLWHRSSDLGSTTPRQVAAQSRSKRKTIKMLVLTVICFAISWAPINCYHLLTHFSHVRHNSTAILICHMIAMSSAMYNPFIFCGLNEHFRREAVKWLHCFRPRRSTVVHPGTEVNGMLTREDQVSRRNMSSTVLHTTVSSRRSPQPSQQQQHISTSPRSGQIRRILGSGSPIATTAAIYVSPRQEDIIASTSSSALQRVAVSPVAWQLLSNMGASISGTNRSSSRCQPELAFLVKNGMFSLANDEQRDPDEINSRQDVVNRGEDFQDSFCEEWYSSGDCSDCRNGTQLERDKSDRHSLSKETTGNNGHGQDAAEVVLSSDEYQGDDENGELDYLGECETTDL